MRLLFFVSLLFWGLKSFSQDSVQIYQPTELFAKFPGGIDSMKLFIRKNLKMPTAFQQICASGKVIVKFTVDQNGLLNNIVVLKDSMGNGASEEAIRLMKSMPKWIPAYLDGKPVKSFYTLPITFGNIE